MPNNVHLNRVIDWFVPAELLAEREMRTRARMFLVSHLFGPILSNPIPAYLLWVDPGSAGTLAVLAGSITGFWIFPFLLKYTGRYSLLAHISIQNLVFAILWGCYFYGGLSSPFLPWLVTVPLLAFFYLGASVKVCITILAQIGLSFAGFIALFVFGGHFPHRVDLQDLQVIGLISIIIASVYVSMMALFYAGILASQTEFESEVRKHIETSDLLREATSQAQRAGAAKAEFLAKMSHELRTPLNAVIGYSQILLEDTDPQADPQGVEDLEKIHSAGHHLLQLVNAILDLSKIEAGKMETYIEPMRLDELLARVAERWRADARMASRKLELLCPVGAIDSDSSKLEQAMDILIENAVAYAPASNIRVEVRPTLRDNAPAVEICVEDHGPGIPQELLSTLFETFSDRDDHSGTKYGGAGLGLPLCYRLCRLMGGRLYVRATSALGAQIVIELPRSAAGAPAQIQQAA